MHHTMGGSTIVWRLLAALLFGSLVVAAPAAAQLLPCQTNQTVDPCFINTTTNIPAGTYDIRPRSLQVGNRALTITGSGEFKVIAQNIVLQPGARIFAAGTPDNTGT